VSVNPPEVAVGGVCVHDDALLLVRRGRGPAQGEWSVPGGRVERGETLHEAVVRETLEETGLEVVVDRFLGWSERVDDNYHYVILDFVVTALDPAQAPVAGDDAAEAAWVPIAGVTDLRLVSGLYDFLRDHGALDGEVR
jgi:8-oxo-dGTP diphosphatase